MKLHLGCGHDYRDGFVNVDVDPNVKADWHGDATHMPFDSDHFEYIYSNHSLEHFDNLFDIVDELARVSKDGAIWEINVPYWSWPTNQGNPWHKINFSEDTFRFFDKGKRGLHKRREQPYSIETVEAEVIMDLNKLLTRHTPREIKFKLKVKK